MLSDQFAWRWLRRQALRAAAVALFTGVFAGIPLCAESHPGSEFAIHLSSPLQDEVFQRKTRLKGAVLVEGDAPGADRVEARITGESLAGPLTGEWVRLQTEFARRHFRRLLPTPAGGFYVVEVRAWDLSGRQVTVEVHRVGVGEVFVIAGQSNSTNYGEVLQKTETGMVSSFDGTKWVPANDPQPGAQDNSKKGSFAPAFGDAMYRRYHVPIGIASTGHGSTSVRQWLPEGTPVHIMPTMTRYIRTEADGTLVSDGTLFDGLVRRIRALGPHGFRAILWHQGESDSHQAAGHEIAATTYESMMKTLIRASRVQAGWDVPWVVAQASYHTPEDPACPPIREAQQNLWREGVAIEGPDTDALTAAYRQNGGRGTHFNDAGLKAHGQLWADAVERYLDKVLAR